MIKVDYLRHSGSDLAVVDAARVSFDVMSEWEMACQQCGKTHDGSNCGEACVFREQLKDDDARLINFLARHKHKSPFNHAFISFRVHAPIFVARQLVKHEYLPWNEVSRRYVEGDLEWYCPDDDDWRSQPANVKQGSGEPLPLKDTHDIAAGYQELLRVAENLYYNSIELGLSREQARMFLPQSLMTTWVWSGSIYAFMKMCSLRLDSHAQREASYVAQPILNHLKKHFPVSAEALLVHGAD